MPPVVQQPKIGVVGGGPGGLIAAQRLAEAGCQVTVFEHMASVGRKFLVAGRGGLNLTHSEPMDQFLGRYGSASDRLSDALGSFDPDALRAWALDLGEPTFVGTSGRVFPESLRATTLLRSWIERLEALGVRIETRHRWVGFCDSTTDEITHDTSIPGGVAINVANSHEVIACHRFDAVVLALGGASWPSVGSDGEWVAPVTEAGLRVTPLTPANAGVQVSWTDVFRERFAGEPIKNAAFTAGSSRSRAEAVVTESGLEGGAIYAVGSAIRSELEARDESVLSIDLQPHRTVTEVEALLDKRRPKESMTSMLKRSIRLSPVAVGLLREATGNDLPTSSSELAALVKDTKIRITGSEPLDRAISTAGGLCFDELDERYMLRQVPGVFAAGEMLDWEAPTGGYLLQATFATAVAATNGVLDWLDGEGRGR